MQTFVLLPAPHPSRDRALQAVRNAPDGMCVVIKEPTRTLEQIRRCGRCSPPYRSKWIGTVNG
jgi:hypothetical protein